MSGSPPLLPALAPPRPAACLSDLRIDAWLARDLPAAEEAALRLHLGGCPACGARVAAIQSTRDRASSGADAGWDSIRRVVANGGHDRGRRSAARRRWWAPSLVVAGAAVAALALILYPRPPGPDGVAGAGAAGERSKGGARLGFFVKHGERLRRGGVDEVVSPGDLVRFTVSGREPLYVTVLAVDATGTATVFFPAGGHLDGPLPAGQDVDLPRATELDDAPGVESVYGVFCPGPIDVEQLRRSLQAHPAQLVAPAGCTVDRLAWTKARAR